MGLKKKRNILILGACGSIGNKILEKFLENERHSHYIACYHKHNFLFKFKKKFKGNNIEFISLDLKKKNNNKFFNYIKNNKIDVFINASGAINRKEFFKEKFSEWSDIMDINLNIPMKIIKILLAKMIKNNYGKVINFTSQVVKKTHSAASPSYEVSKAGMSSLNRYLAKKFAKYNINFNTIMPGTIKSRMQNSMSKKDINNIKKEIPQNRLGSPEEVADLVFFICSDKASYINGASINISGASILD
jgi:3-oxoacyl-[acyl-carrier protein] reductase